MYSPFSNKEESGGDKRRLVKEKTQPRKTVRLKAYGTGQGKHHPGRKQPSKDTKSTGVRHGKSRGAVEKPPPRPHEKKPVNRAKARPEYAKKPDSARQAQVKDAKAKLQKQQKMHQQVVEAARRREMEMLAIEAEEREKELERMHERERREREEREEREVKEAREDRREQAQKEKEQARWKRQKEKERLELELAEKQRKRKFDMLKKEEKRLQEEREEKFRKLRLQRERLLAEKEKQEEHERVLREKERKFEREQKERLEQMRRQDERLQRERERVRAEKMEEQRLEQKRKEEEAEKEEKMKLEEEKLQAERARIESMLRENDRLQAQKMKEKVRQENERRAQEEKQAQFERDRQAKLEEIRREKQLLEEEKNNLRKLENERQREEKEKLKRIAQEKEKLQEERDELEAKLREDEVERHSEDEVEGTRAATQRAPDQRWRKKQEEKTAKLREEILQKQRLEKLDERLEGFDRRRRVGERKEKAKPARRPLKAADDTVDTNDHQGEKKEKAAQRANETNGGFDRDRGKKVEKKEAAKPAAPRRRFSKTQATVHTEEKKTTQGSRISRIWDDAFDSTMDESMEQPTGRRPTYSKKTSDNTTVQFDFDEESLVSSAAKDDLDEYKLVFTTAHRAESVRLAMLHGGVAFKTELIRNPRYNGVTVNSAMLVHADGDGIVARDASAALRYIAKTYGDGDSCSAESTHMVKELAAFRDNYRGSKLYGRSLKNYEKMLSRGEGPGIKGIKLTMVDFELAAVVQFLFANGVTQKDFASEFPCLMCLYRSVYTDVRVKGSKFPLG